MMGAVLGSSPEVHHLDELAGLYLVWRDLRWGRALASHKRDYQQFLAQATANYYRTAHDAPFCCDSSPLNLLVVEEIREALPEAQFILCFRGVSEVSASLQRSYDQGFEWAGSGTSERVEIWLRFYRNIARLPAESTHVFRYDDFASDPRGRWPTIASSLDSLGFSSVDPAVLSVSHATGAAPRPTFAERDTSGGLVLRSGPSPSERLPDPLVDQENAVSEVLTMLTALEAGGATNLSG
jgi:hypothetical protein